MIPKVSVVVKSYNHAKYVRQALDSVLAQTLQDFEIVIIDDGSADGTAAIIAGYSDPRIVFAAWPQNRGLSNAMNAGLSRATGTYVAILNSDDCALPDRLERQVAYLDAHPEAVALFTQVRFVDDDGNELPERKLFRPPLAFPDFSRTTWLRQFFVRGNCLCAPSAMVRRSAYARAGVYDPRLTNLQDLDVWVRMTAVGELHVLPDKLTAFRIRAGDANLSAPRRDALLRHQFEHYRILLRYLDFDADLLRATFADDLARHGIAAEGPPAGWLAEFALRVDRPAHRLFAVQTLFDNARTDAECHRLREITGSTDVFGVMTGRGFPQQPRPKAKKPRRALLAPARAIWKRIKRGRRRS